MALAWITEKYLTIRSFVFVSASWLGYSIVGGNVGECMDLRTKVSYKGWRPLSSDQLSDPKVQHATKYLKMKVKCLGTGCLGELDLKNGKGDCGRM